MPLVLPKVLTSTQNTDLINGCLNGVRLPRAHCTLCPSFESTHRSSTRTSGERERFAHKHKCYSSQGSAGVLDFSLLKMI